MSINLDRHRQAPPAGYGMQQQQAGGTPMGASAPPMNYGSQPQYGAQQQQQPYGTQPQQQPYGAQQSYGSQQPYGAQQKPYGTAPAYGQAPMQQPQYGAPPQQPYGTQQPPYQQQQYGGASQQPYQAGGPMGMANPAMGMPMGMAAPVNAMGMNTGSVSLVKGGNMSLTKAVPNLQHVIVGLGWDVRSTPGAPFDLDASCFMLKGDGRVRMPQDLIFYNNLRSVDGSVMHMGDNLTGQGEGDDEQVTVDLLRVPPDIQKIVIVCSIYEAEQRGQNFGMVNRAFIRVSNLDNKMEIVRFDLTEEASMFNCMVFGELYRYNNEWKFRAIGQGVPGGLRSCGPMFGLAMQ